jgi:4-diphosphocytidyl-2-C-methyl-D-erythritol kinase
MARLALPAPAKVNLGLRIVGRRADGYHELESLFLPLGFGDELVVEVGPGAGIALSLEGGGLDEVPEGPGNLAWRAARGFLDAAGEERAVTLRLTKRIPAGAGLGGGSSDAAAVLRGMACLLPGAVAADALRALALSLGADVPFFLDPRPAWVEGVGERIAPVEGVPALPLVLAHPGTALATAAVYAAYDEGGVALTPAGAAPTLRALAALRSATAPGPTRLAEIFRGRAGELVVNDLESAAVRLCPALVTLRERLAAAGALAVGLSGSGPTLYGVFPSREEAESAVGRLDLAQPARAWAAMTMASSPRTGEPSHP